MNKRKRMTRLTDEQRDFAAKNHGLVFSFMIERGLIADEFYDIIIFGYLMAVQRYLERSDLREHPFGTIAGKHMRRELNHYYKSLFFAKRHAELCSLNVNSGNELEIQEQFATPGREIYENLEACEEWEKIRPLAKPHELEALELYAQGYTRREIGEMHNVTPYAIAQRLFNLRKRVRAACPA